MHADARYRRRKAMSHFFVGLTLLSTVAAVSALFLILWYVVANAGSSINIDLFTKLPVPAGETGGGMGNAVVGSFIVLGIASGIALPIGLFTAIYLSEFRTSPFASVVRFIAETMAGIPSIVIGIFAYVLIVQPTHTFSAVAGGFALSVIMIPIFTRASEVSLNTVPFSIREASLALGVPVWKTVLRVIVPSAGPGIITAFMLAMARAAGETAPLLFTSLNNSFWQKGLMSPIATLPVQIYTYAIGPYHDWHSKAWAGSLLLVAITIAVIALVRLAYARASLRQ